MGLLNRVFESHIETRDHHSDPRLRTRYYKTNKNKAIESILNWINQEPSFKLIDQSNERGEVAAQVTGKRKGLLVITIVSTNPIRTAVDISFSVDRGLNLGYGQKICDSLYSKMGQTFEEVVVN